ncbi:MAG: PEGA domain-containing protein, partial [Deltaproteobacteria bacterium]
VDVIPQSDHTKPSGSLKISSDPTDALVLLDGNPMGNTDMETSGVEIGKRKLELKKDCFETKTTEVFIKANQQVILNLKLKASCGAISVTSNPAGADILMNEKLMGVTPAELTELKDGTHTISLKKAGYEEWKDTVTVKAGKTVLIKADRLKPAVMVKLPSQQPMTEINPPATEQKTSELHFTVGATDSLPVEPSGISTGNQQITVKKDGYPDHDKTVAVQEGKTTSATASLKPPSKYSKLDSNGKQLPNSAQSWLMVLDSETNLIWEVKQNKDGVKDYDNPNDADNTYTWDESNQKFINALNAAHLGGFSDWRLPSLREIKTLVVFSRRSPAIDTDYFPNTQSSFYWSSTTYADSTSYAWGVYFKGVDDHGYGKGDSYYVRAVREGK